MWALFNGKYITKMIETKNKITQKKKSCFVWIDMNVTRNYIYSTLITNSVDINNAISKVSIRKKSVFLSYEYSYL